MNKSENDLSLRLVRTPDILAAKRLDLIVANDVTAPDAGFGGETNRVLLIGRDGSVEALPLMSKAAVAEAVVERAAELLEG